MYFQENRTSRRPFLLLRIRFPGRPIFTQFFPGCASTRCPARHPCPRSRSSAGGGSADHKWESPCYLSQTNISYISQKEPAQGYPGGRWSGLGWLSCWSFLVLLGQMGIRQNRISSWSKWWNLELKVNSTQVRDNQGSPCIRKVRKSVCVVST